MTESSKFGVLARDKITGFVGIITGRAEYITGCVQLCLVPKVDDKGNIRDAQWFDIARVEVIQDEAKTGALEFLEPGQNPGDGRGGPQRDAPR